MEPDPSGSQILPVLCPAAAGSFPAWTGQGPTSACSWVGWWYIPQRCACAHTCVCCTIGACRCVAPLEGALSPRAGRLASPEPGEGLSWEESCPPRRGDSAGTVGDSPAPAVTRFLFLFLLGWRRGRAARASFQPVGESRQGWGKKGLPPGYYVPPREPCAHPLPKVPAAGLAGPVLAVAAVLAVALS